jgi:hypothetical protein
MFPISSLSRFENHRQAAAESIARVGSLGVVAAGLMAAILVFML